MTNLAADLGPVLAVLLVLIYLDKKDLLDALLSSGVFLSSMKLGPGSREGRLLIRPGS